MPGESSMKGKMLEGGKEVTHCMMKHGNRKDETGLQEFKGEII